MSEAYPSLAAVKQSGLYPAYYQNYLERCPAQPLPILLAESYPSLGIFWRQLDPVLLDRRYAPGKWSPREILLHISDTERILSARALALARGEKAALAGFDHDQYVAQSGAAQRDWEDLYAEYQAVRRSSQLLFQSFSPQQWQAQGEADGQRISVAALAYMLPGHDLHHQAIVRERYFGSQA